MTADKQYIIVVETVAAALKIRDIVLVEIKRCKQDHHGTHDKTCAKNGNNGILSGQFVF